MRSQPSTRVALVAVLLLMSPTAVFSRAPVSLATAWEKGDQKAIYAFSSMVDAARYLNLGDAEIAALVLPMARQIPLQDTLESSSDQSWKNFKTEGDWTPFLNALPNTDPIKKRWCLGELAASACRALAEKGRLKSKVVIPYLIAGLDHPCRGSTARDCFYALVALTRLYDGQDPIDESQESIDALKDWYTRWWEANQDADLIVDAKLKSRIDARFLATCRRVKLATDNPHHTLSGFKIPTLGRILRTSQALRETSYFPGGRFSGIDLGRAGMASWIWIGVVSKSPPLTTIQRWPESSLDPALTMPAGTKEIFHEAVPNSDWQVKVYTNRVPVSDNEVLVSYLSHTP